jgi:hypothetical protein
MSAGASGTWSRSIAVIAVIALCIAVATSELRLAVWSGLLPLFEWMETTPFAALGKTWGAVFAVVQAVHLLSMAALGGAVLVADARLLGLLFTELPARQVQEQCHHVFVPALSLAVATGVFMACSVALKIYYLPVFWYKMLALAAGVAFVFGVRRPLLRGDIESLQPGVLRLLAIASLMLWFSVAATGRWIGFSG